MQGWECPKCGRCYSPYTAQCAVCGQYGSGSRYGAITLMPQGELSCPKCGQNLHMPTLNSWTVVTLTNASTISAAS